MRYHLTPIGMVIIQKSGNKKWWQEHGEIGALFIGHGNARWAVTLKKIWLFPKQIKHSITIWSSSSISSYIPKGIEKPGTWTDICILIIQNSQKVKANQMSINRWMGKQNVVFRNIILTHAATQKKL